MNIAVLLGGISPERNVSYASGKSIAEALQSNGHSVTLVDPALGAVGEMSLGQITLSMEREPTLEELKNYDPRKLLECINSPLFDRVDLAFLALHGKYGEDGYMQSLLELRGVRYTGSKVLASAVAMDKIMSKRLFGSVGIPTPAWVVVEAEHADDLDFLREVRDEMRSGMVIKPNDQGSTVGVTLLPDGDLDEMRAGIHEALRYGPMVLIEQFIEGSELTVGVLGTEALPIVEIVPEGGFYDYRHKYSRGHTEYICPAEIDEENAEFISTLAVTAHTVLGCQVYSRVDFRLDDEGRPFCLEVNTLPGMTSASLLPKAAAAAGLDFAALCESIIELS